MDLDYALDRLYQSGWSPGLSQFPCDSLPDGRRFPTIADIKREFEQAGLELTIKHNLMFNTFRATWTRDQNEAGMVIGNSECEAAVYALAQLRESQSVPRLALA